MGLILISFWTDFILLLGCAVLVFYFWMRHRYEYWKNKGIDGPEPELVFGHLAPLVTKKLSTGEIFLKIYEKTNHLPYCGIYLMLRPCWVVNDPELIKRIMIGDFAHFTDHGHDFNYRSEPLADNLFNIGGDRWKQLRLKLTPTFTTSKMRQMFTIVESCSRVMVESLEDDEVLDFAEVMGKFATDAIGSCAFGIDCNSFKDPDADFWKYAQKLMRLPPNRALFQFIQYFVPPGLLKWSPISILGRDMNNFFFNTVKSTISFREKHKVDRNDLFQLLMHLKKCADASDDETDDVEMSLERVAAQAFVFFFAGFETSSTASSFALYELAKNPDVQSTLIKEIDDALLKQDGRLTYDSLGEMTYLTMVVEETLRKYPPLPTHMRVCTKEYTIPGTNIVIEKDTPVMIPIYGIQRDERYYPDPERFNPTRFTPENKESRNNFTFLPFGEGPRICIGSRFGMMQTKMGLVALLSKYTVAFCEKTPTKMVYDKESIFLKIEGGVFLKVTKRR